jgi:hypothetical protein
LEQRLLGRTGVSVSPLCLGAMTFGAWGNNDKQASMGIIRRALDAGINFIDTADVYSSGESGCNHGDRVTGRFYRGSFDVRSRDAGCGSHTVSVAASALLVLPATGLAHPATSVTKHYRTIALRYFYIVPQYAAAASGRVCPASARLTGHTRDAS